MSAAERAHPPPAPGVLSKPVSMIAGVFGEMAYQKIQEISVTDDKLCELIEGFLNVKIDAHVA